MIDNVWYGEWWIPTEPDIHFYGYAVYKSGSLQVELNILCKDFVPKEEIPSTIWGISDKGDTISLVGKDCASKVSGWSYSGDILTQISYNFDYIVSGIHCESLDDIFASSVNIEMDNLNSWCNCKKILNDSIIEIAEKYCIVNVLFEVSIKKTLKILLLNSVQIKYDNEKTNEQKIVSNANIQIDYPNAEKLNDILDSINIIRKFFCFATGNSSRVNVDFRDIKIYGSDYYYNVSLCKNYTLESAYLADSSLFTLSDVVDKMDIILNKWFELCEKLSPVIDLYLLLTESNCIDQEFLLLLQALEAYHRIINPCDANQIESHNRNIICMCEKVTLEEQKIIKERLNYAYEPSLRKRLKELLKDVDDIVIIGGGNKKCFIEDICNARNYLTHYDDKLKPKVISGQKMLLANHKMIYLLEYLVLKNIGFGNENAKKIIKNKYGKHIPFNKKWD